jgi:hypothetical protein
VSLAGVSEPYANCLASAAYLWSFIELLELSTEALSCNEYHSIPKHPLHPFTQSLSLSCSCSMRTRWYKIWLFSFSPSILPHTRVTVTQFHHLPLTLPPLPLIDPRPLPLALPLPIPIFPISISPPTPGPGIGFPCASSHGPSPVVIPCPRLPPVKPPPPLPRPETIPVCPLPRPKGFPGPRPRIPPRIGTAPGGTALPQSTHCTGWALYRSEGSKISFHQSGLTNQVTKSAKRRRRAGRTVQRTMRRVSTIL